ncbi:hypothetical protein CAMRE0001_3277 [Campylobacter rectus RM3267]|uniref:Uncharacterized protein n=1 Tax=Campylobacter rectus RM3267 TaxID=553218 RepID=B9D5M8_CAMRE|nr:hypothetical protein CAMRE0001_3277 [Campylobacter rectus RM3267]
MLESSKNKVSAKTGKFKSYEKNIIKLAPNAAPYKSERRKSKSDKANDLRMCDELGARAGKSAFLNEPCRLNQR